MVWIVKGPLSGVAFHVGRKCQRSFRGVADRHEPIQPGDEFSRDMDRTFKYDWAFYNELSDCDCSWRIGATNALDTEILLYGNDLLKRVEADPDTTHCAIGMHRNPGLLGVAVLLPPDMLQQVWELFFTAAGIARMEYVVSLEFEGFRHSYVDVPVPTIEEFAAGGIYLTSVEGITIQRGDQSA